MKFLRLTQGLAAISALLATATVSMAQQTYTSPADRDAASRSAYARGDSAQVNAALSEAVRLNPFDPVALNNLAVNYAATGDYQNAVSLLERAQRLAPNRADIVNNLANLKAWMAQDSQFALGTRSATPQALNFPRAEDVPPELPPLWAGPQTYTAPGLSQGARAVAPAYGNGMPTGVAPSQAMPQAGQQPVYGQQLQAPPITYQQGSLPVAPPSVPMQARAYSKASSSAPADYTSRIGRQTVITERATTSAPKKRKRAQILDCPVP